MQRIEERHYQRDSKNRSCLIPAFANFIVRAIDGKRIDQDFKRLSCRILLIETYTREGEREEMYTAPFALGRL